MGNETLQIIAAAVVGGLIVPIVGALKMTVIVKYVKPEFLTLTLAALAVWGLAAWQAPELTANDIILLAMAATGTGSIVYGTKKIAKKG